MKTPIRWGILGCGDVTERKSGPALQKATNSQLVAVMRRDAEKAEDYARRHDVPFWTSDADELINRDDVDIVYIATPPGAHLELALKVCAAKKPCYVEKPPARSAWESQKMVEAFERVKTPLFVAFYRRALPRFQTVKRLLEEEKIGVLTGVSYQYFSPRHTDISSHNLPWRLKAEDSGGGLFLDLGSHLLDIFDFLFGPLENIGGIAQNRASHFAVEDTVAMSFTANGAPGVAIWNFASFERRDAIEIQGTLGKISLSCFGGDVVRLETAHGVEEFPGELPEHVHQFLVQSIVDELRGIGKCPSTGESGHRTMEVIDTVLAIYYGGRVDEFWTREESWTGLRAFER